MALIGYARVSSVGQSLDIQIEKLEAAGAERIFQEKRSGVDSERPQLQAMLDHIREGDTVLISKTDRLARNAADLLTMVERFNKDGITLKALDQPDIDTTTSTGKAMISVFAVFAEMETTLRKERQMEGIAKAKEKGIKFGRKAILTAKQEDEIHQLRQSGLSFQKIADQMGVSKGLVHKTVKAKEAT